MRWDKNERTKDSSVVYIISGNEKISILQKKKRETYEGYTKGV